MGKAKAKPFPLPTYVWEWAIKSADGWWSNVDGWVARRKDATTFDNAMLAAIVANARLPLVGGLDIKIVGRKVPKQRDTFPKGEGGEVYERPAIEPPQAREVVDAKGIHGEDEGQDHGEAP